MIDVNDDGNCEYCMLKSVESANYVSVVCTVHNAKHQVSMFQIHNLDNLVDKLESTRNTRNAPDAGKNIYRDNISSY